MGGTSFHRDDYEERENYRATTGTSAFTYHEEIKTGKASGVHKQMNPFNAVRESRDSPEHPITLPIGISMDLTGSMSTVPKIFQKALAKLMGQFLEDKASGKRYLGEAYPAILIAGHDDYPAQVNMGYDKGAGAVQVGQFESGIEIDDDLGRIWFTENGGGGGWESYQLMLYFFARKTKHDHFDKRGKKGYLFIFGDEKPFAMVKKSEVADVFGDGLESDITTEQIVAEASERYHIFYILPKMTSHWGNQEHLNVWRALLTPEHVLELEDPAKICELIVATVAMYEENASLEDLMSDNIATGLDKALVPLSRKVGEVSKYVAANLPAVTTTSGGTERL